MVALWTMALAVCEPADGRTGVGSIECASLEPVERRAVAASTLGTLDVLRGWLLRQHTFPKGRLLWDQSGERSTGPTYGGIVRNGLERRHGRRLGQRVQIRRDRCETRPPRAISNRLVSPASTFSHEVGGRPKHTLQVREVARRANGQFGGGAGAGLARFGRVGLLLRRGAVLAE